MKGIVASVLLFLAIWITGIRAYSVSGNQLMGPTGEPIQIRGMCRPSLEWQADGQYLSLNDYTIMKNEWKVNVVRLSLNQMFWLTEATGSASPAMKYSDRVQQQVEWIKGLGMGVILDLHWSEGSGSGVGQQCMADANSITFWSQVAAKYKNDPWIIFELYNEPHDTTWEVWRNGGNGCGFNVAGMQQLYDAVRGAGADNVVIVNGLNYAYDLSQIDTYKLDGNNIMYGTHPYNYPGKLESDWDTGFGHVPANFPVIATEFGQYCATTEYVASLIAYFESKKIHWTAWAWWVQDCQFPSVIADWNGAPFGAVGNVVKNAIATGNAAQPSAGTATEAPTEQPSQPTEAPVEPTEAPVVPTEAPVEPTEAPAQPTEAPVQPTEQPSGGGGSGTSVTVKVHEGFSSWWLAVSSIEVSGKEIDSVELEDSSNGATWQPFPKTWAYVYQAAPLQFVLPLSIKIKTTDGYQAEVDGIITDFGQSTKSQDCEFTKA